MATLDPNSTLSLLQLNAWSGSTYELNWSVRNFTSYETPDQIEARYQSTLSQITALAPDVITLQECMPTFKYAQRLAQDLGYDCYARTGVAGIILGPLHIPSNKITEGDAILAKREWNLKVIGRKALTGMVFGEYFSLNTDNATQTIGVEVTKGGRKFHIYCTHCKLSNGFQSEQRTRGWLHRTDGAFGAMLRPVVLLPLLRRTRHLPLLVATAFVRDSIGVGRRRHPRDARRASRDADRRWNRRDAEVFHRGRDRRGRASSRKGHRYARAGKQARAE